MIKPLTIIGIVFLFFFCCFMQPKITYASKTPHCTDPNPGSTPMIVNVTTTENSVTLVWTESVEPVTHYLLAYGLTKEQLIYGAPNIGAKGTTSYTVNQLTTGQRYYFRIKAINNCEPGSFSDTVSVVVGKDPEEILYKMPKLSIYKSVLGTSSASPKKHPITVAAVRTAPFCVNCYGLPLLGIQAVFLVVFLYLSHKISYLRPMYALSIPLLFYLLFRIMHYDCSSNDFFCRYYLQVNIIVFVLLMIFHKFAFIHRKIESFEDHFIKSLNI